MNSIEENKNALDIPQVSIITPIYNCEKYIGETIQSVLVQTYKNWEMILVDDISTDKTVDISRSFAAKDPRIKILQLNAKGGASIARNMAINKARGRYIAFLDGDDLWLPSKLRKQIDFMIKNDYAFTYTNYYVAKGEFNSRKDEISNLEIKTCPPEITYNNLLKKNCVGCLTVVFDTEKTGKVNIPRLDKRNDYALWLKILKKGFTGILFPEPLAVHRSHQGLSKGSKFKLLKYHYRVFTEVLGYGKTMAFIMAARNALYYLQERIFLR